MIQNYHINDDNLYFYYTKNVSLPQDIFEQVKLIGESRLDDCHMYLLKKTTDNYNFFNFLVKYNNDKNYIRKLKLNKILNIQNKEFNEIEEKLLDFFTKDNTLEQIKMLNEIQNKKWI